MEDSKYDNKDLREAVHTIIASEKTELVYLLGNFSNEEELKTKINDTKDWIESVITVSNNKSYERTLKDLELFEQILFGEMIRVPLNINGCFKDLAKWRLKHGR